VPSSRSIVIANGVRLPHHVEAHPPSGPALCIANLIAYKGHDVLLDAFARAVEDVPHAMLWLAGTGPELTALPGRAAALGIGDRVEFLGSVGNVGPLLEACAFTVLASRSEGMPNVVLESLASGRPVIASAVGGVPELLQGGGGILVPPDDAEAFAAAMIELWSDPVRAAAVGEVGRREVASRFSLERMVDATSSLYRVLLEERGVELSVRDPLRVGP
jgi:glycosyltransferase involved in cell wall biosynthesis